MVYETKNIKIKNDEFWFNDFSIIFNKERLIEFFPSSYMNNDEKLNSLLRFSIIITFVLFLKNKNYNLFIIPIVTALITLYIFKFNTIEKKQNEKLNIENYENSKCSKPTEDNPFGNTLLTDVSNYKKKEEACLIEENIDEINNHFNKGLFKDVNDLYGKNNSQRQFFSMPNTNEYGIKNGDSVKFANWLYNSGEATCKEDTSKCIVNDRIIN
tara:strand:- start:84 stop:722 length:639 start_codon:yes stop_codon:yes gene_type:complete